MTTEKQLDMWTEEGLKESREDARSAGETLYAQKRKDVHTDVVALETLLTDCGATSVPQLRWVLLQSCLHPYIFTTDLKALLLILPSLPFFFCRETLLRLRRENAQLRGLLKEQKSAECKEKESADASGESSDGQAELRRSLETLHAESQGPFSVPDGKNTVTSALTVGGTDGMVNLQIKNPSYRRSPKQHVAKHRVL